MAMFAGTGSSRVQILTNAYPSFPEKQLLVSCSPQEAFRFNGETRLWNTVDSLYAVPDTAGNREVFYELHEQNPNVKLVATFG